MKRKLFRTSFLLIYSQKILYSHGEFFFEILYRIVVYNNVAIIVDSSILNFIP